MEQQPLRELAENDKRRLEQLAAAHDEALAAEDRRRESRAPAQLGRRALDLGRTRRRMLYGHHPRIPVDEL